MPRTKMQVADGSALEFWSGASAHIASIFNDAGTLKVRFNDQIDFISGSTIAASITSSGNLKCYNSLTTGSTVGFFHLGSVAGAPVGTPTTYSGLVPMCYDRTNFQLYIYSSLWRAIGGISNLNGLTNGSQTFSATNDTNVTLTIGASGGTIHTFTMGWSGTLGIARGGTNASSFSSNGVVYYNGSALVNGSEFVFDGTNAGLGTSPTSSQRLYIYRSDSVSATRYALYIVNASTSSTSAIEKYGIASTVTGNWSGSFSTCKGIRSHVYSTSCPYVYGIQVEAYDGGTATYGIHIDTGFSTGTDYGVYVDSTIYAIYINNGSCLFKSAAFDGEVRTEDSLSTSSTSGFFYLSAVAGTPSGTPTAYSGTVPLVYDSSNNKLYAYNGGWKSVTLA